MSASLIIQPFASTGDLVTIPQTDPNGFVNYTQGYTPFYEISLASGNPQAKPVERQVQNALFNILTGNTQAWQQQGFSPWFAAMPSGYGINAMVVRQNASNNWIPYRSLVAGNMSDPLTSPTSWEYIPFGHEMLANIPMPAGGVAGSSAAIVTVSSDFNGFGTGTYQFLSDAVASGSAHSPAALNNATVAGMLEVSAWTNGATTYILQRYLDRNGFVFTRTSTNGAWTGWANLATVSETQTGSTIFAVDTGAANAIVASFTPTITTRTEGQIIRVKAAFANTGATTINDGVGIVPLVGAGHAALQGGEIIPVGELWCQWNGNVGTGSYVLVTNTLGAQSHSAGAYGVTPPTTDNSNKFVTSNWVKQLLGAFPGTVSYSVSTTLTNAVSGFAIGSTGATINFTIPLGSTMPQGTKLTIYNSGTGVLTLLAQGSDKFYKTAANTVTSIALQISDAITIVSQGNGSWNLVEGSAMLQFISGLVLTSPQVNGTANFAARPNYAGNTPWDTGNLPAPAQLTGAAFTGATSYAAASTYSGPVTVNSTLSMNGAAALLNGTSLQVTAPGNTYAQYLAANVTGSPWVGFINSAKNAWSFTVSDAGVCTAANSFVAPTLTANSGQLTLTGWGGAANEGVLYFGLPGYGHYLLFDGTNYTFAGGNLYFGGGTGWNTVNLPTPWYNGNNAFGISGNGYHKFADGLILQWGVANASAAVSYNLAWPNAVWGVHATVGASSGSTNYFANVTLNAGYFTIYAFNSSSGGSLSGVATYWFAIGY